MNNNQEQRRLLSALCHGSIFFCPFIVPIVIWLISDDLVIKNNAREALNFHLNLLFYIIFITLVNFLLYGVIFWLDNFFPGWLTFIFGLLIIGLIGLGVLGVTVVMPIIAIYQVSINPQEPYRYPFIIRLL